MENDSMETKVEGTIPLSSLVANMYGGYKGITYRTTVLSERDELIKNLNAFKGYCTDIDKLKGNIAEEYHAGTFNLDAAMKGSSHRVYVDHSHEFASTDISSNYGKKYGLKYYKTAEESAKQQAKSVFERFKEYQAKGGQDSLADFLKKRHYTDEAVLNDPIYKGQVRIVPKEQMEDAVKWLERKIAEEGAKRPEQVARYKETLKLLKDRIADGKGAESIPLSTEDAKKLAQLAKEGKIDAKVLNLSDSDVMKLNYVVQNAAKVGLQAAAISAGVSLVVEVLQKYLSEGKSLADFEREDWAEIFGDTLFNAGVAGISATTLSIVGSYCQSAVPGVGALLMAVFGIAALVPDYMDGKISQEEFIVEAEMVCLDAALILAGSALGQMAIPVPGLGMAIGAIAASIAWQIINYFWGDELRELLVVINQKIAEMLDAIKEFFVGLWEALVEFFKNLLDHIKLLLDKDFNYNLKYKYKTCTQSSFRTVPQSVPVRTKEVNHEQN